MDRAVMSCLVGVLVSSGACGGEEVDPCLEPGVLCTIAGTGESGYAPEPAPAREARLSLPIDVTPGPDGLHVLDWNNRRIVRIDEDGWLQPFAGTTNLGNGPYEGPALEVELERPSSLVFDEAGDAFLAAGHGGTILRHDRETGVLTRVAGDGTPGYHGDGGPALEAGLGLPVSLVLDGDGLIVVDQVHQVLRRIDADGLIERFAGTCVVNRDRCAAGEEPASCPGSDKTFCAGEESACSDSCQPGDSPDGVPRLDLAMAQPFGYASDPGGRLARGDDGSIYVSDSRNHRVRRIRPDGIVETVAGSGRAGTGGDGGDALDAELFGPTDLALGADGTLYIADTHNHCVRAVDPAGILRTVAGICGESGDAPEGALATAAPLTLPYGIALDEDGRLLIADTGNDRIRAVTPRW